MKRLLLFLAFAASCFAAGTVQQSFDKLGGSDTYVLAFRWQGDSVDGSVPITPGKGLTAAQGYVVTGVQVVPGTPSPTPLYSVTLPDGSGIDLLGGAATSLSATVPAAFTPSGATIPLQGALSLSITGQAAAGAKGAVFIFLVKPSAFTIAQPSTPAGVNWITQVNNKPVIDVRTFGADPTGTRDSTAAVQAALNAGAGNEVLIPAGFFNISGTVAIGSGTWLHGAGLGTQINHTNSGVDLFTVADSVRTTVSDMFIFGASDTGGWALNVTGGVNFTARHLFVLGMPSGVRISAVSTAVIQDSSIRSLLPVTGVGILSTDASIEVRIQNIIMDNDNAAQPLAGIQVKNSPYTQIDTCEIVRAGWGLLVNPQTGESVVDLTVNNSLFDGPSRAPIALLPNGNGTTGSALVWRAKFLNVWASGAGFFPVAGDNSLSGVVVVPSNGGQVIESSFRGMTILNNRQNGMDIEGGANTYDTSVEDCWIVGNSYPSGGTAGLFSGILIGPDVGNIKINNNVLGTNQTTGGFNNGTYQTQASGLSIAAGTGDNIVAIGNRIPGSTFAPIFIDDANTGTHMLFSSNSPTNNQGSAIASATTVGLNGQPFVLYDVTGTTDIATVNNGWVGRNIILTRHTSGTVNFLNTGNMAKAFSLSQGDSKSCTYDSTVWQCQ